MNLKKIIDSKEHEVFHGEDRLCELTETLYTYTRHNRVSDKHLLNGLADALRGRYLKQSDVVSDVILVEKESWEPANVRIYLKNSDIMYCAILPNAADTSNYRVMSDDMFEVFLQWLSSCVDFYSEDYKKMQDSPSVEELLPDFLEIAKSFASKYTYKGGGNFKLSVEQGRRSYDSSSIAAIVVRYPDGDYRGLIRFGKDTLNYTAEVSVPLAGSYTSKFSLDDADKVIEHAVDFICS